MLKFFDKGKNCHIVIEAPMERADVETLKKLLAREYTLWCLEFACIYSIDIDMVILLYDTIFSEKKKIKIRTHESKLNHYLHNLGFTSCFESLIVEDRVNDALEKSKILSLNKNQDELLEYLLQEIYKKYNYDFRLYHREMIQRRLDIFMLKSDIKTVENAVVAILFHRTAFKAFFLEVSINVTELFRNPHLFKTLSEHFSKEYKNHSSIKIWSAGCSSGEEISSTAILLDIAGLLEKSILYATDFNSVILEEAKNSIYSCDSYLRAKKNFEELGVEANLDEYMDIDKNYVILKEKIKEKILYFQHNLIEDSSFNEFDVIICKNVIIYFEECLQERVFELFYDSLKFGGCLVLGHSEMLSAKFRDKFLQIDDSCKIFRKIA